MRWTILSLLSTAPGCLGLSGAQETAAPEPRAGAAEQWSQFRGPNGQGVLDECEIPVEFGPDSSVLWKIQIEGGQSSPVLWGDRLFLSSCSSEEPRELTTHCVHRETGRVLWRRSVQAEAQVRYYPMNGPASPTPAVDAEHVYVYFGTYGLLCYDHEGDELWERRLDPPKSQYGASSSPILYEDKVLLLVDSNDGSSRLLAMHRDTGATIWERPRPLFGAGWSTPMIWRTSLGDELVVLGCRRLTSYDPADGKELWWAGGFSTETIGVPVAGEEMLFVSDAANGGREALAWDAEATWALTLEGYDEDGDGSIQREEMADGFRIPLRLDLPMDEAGAAYPVGRRRVDGWLEHMDADGDRVLGKQDWLEFMSGFSMESDPIVMAVLPGGVQDVRQGFVEWEIHKWTPEMPSPLYLDGRLYLLRDGGVLAVLDAATGELLFRDRIGALGQYVASPIAAGDKILAASKAGVVTVLKFDGELEILGNHDFDEEILATPALAEDALYLRTVTHLYAIGDGGSE